MRVPKREDQSLFISPLIVRQLSSQSIILDQVQLSYEYYTRSVGFVNPFYKFFSKWRRRESNPRLRWFRHAAFPESTTKYTPDKKRQCGLGRRFPEITTALSQFLMRILPLIKICSLLYICIKITERSDDPWDRIRRFAHRDECLP